MLRNLITVVSPDSIVSLYVLPCLVHVLWDDSVGAQQAVTVTIHKISSSMDMKRHVGEHGCICWCARGHGEGPLRLPLFFRVRRRLEAKAWKIQNAIGEIAAGRK
jgi:hypothetical protein